MAGKYDMTVYQGDTLRRTFVWKHGSTPINLAGFIVGMKARPYRKNAIDLSTFLTVRPAAGAIDLVVPASTTKNWDFSSAPYDLEVTSGGDGSDTRKILRGTIVVTPEETY